MSTLARLSVPPLALAAALLASAPGPLRAQDATEAADEGQAPLPAGDATQTPPDAATVPAPPRAAANPALAALAAQAGSALVVVRCQGRRWGIGFAMDDARTIVAAEYVASCRRELSVASLAGQAAVARVVGGGRRQDITLLAIDAPIGLEPLAARTDAPALGEAVYALGIPGRGATAEGATPIVTGGMVAHSDAGEVLSDVPLPPGGEGGPLLDASGRVVGVLDEHDPDGVSRALSITPVHELVAATPPETEEVRPSVYPGFGLNFGILWDSDDRLLGGAVAMSVDILDRVIFRSELGVYFGDDDELARGTRRTLTIVSLAAGYRFRFAVRPGRTATITPNLGFAISHDKRKTTTQQVGLADPACDLATTTCELTTLDVETESTDWRYRPTAGLRLAAGSMELGYEFLLDVQDASDSGHRIHIGFRF